MTVIEQVYQRALEEYFRDWKYRYLFYLVEDKSTSVSRYELQTRYIIEKTEEVLKNSVQTMGMMTAKIFFDSTLDMQSFKYGLDINSENDVTKENGTSLYDAVVESCNRMIE